MDTIFSRIDIAHRRIPSLSGLDIERDRAEYLRLLREFVSDAGEAILAMHRNGGGGREVVGARALLVDSLVRLLFDLFREKYSQRGEGDTQCSLVALGGYGRGELSPCSDVDILFLYPREVSDFLNYMVEKILYLLWDLGFQVGHSCRSISDCIRMATSDISSLTAMMESRLVAGDSAIFEGFSKALERQVIQKMRRSYIQEKIRERDKRYSHYGGSINLLEPNVKESPGGLRDVHMALWASCAALGTGTLEGLRSMGAIDGITYAQTAEALDFIYRVRNELHFCQSRRNDVLSLEVQKTVAENLGFHGTDKLLPVEEFMRTYYRHAAAINHFSRNVMELCNPQDGGVKSFLSKVMKRELGEELYCSDGKIYLKDDDPSHLGRDPLLILKVFEYCTLYPLKISPTLEDIISSNLHLVDDRFRKGRDARNVFLRILSSERSYKVLRKMHEMGVLGAYIPEFDELTYLTRYDLYHYYTVDEHLLKALENCEELANTGEKELRELSLLYGNLPDKLILKLAVLFHDLGKSEKSGHVQASVEKTRKILRRWRMNQELMDKVADLIANHLEMNLLAQRRDMHDEKLVKQAAEMAGTAENLKFLYLLTYADISAVGPKVWTAWKGALLWELYHRTLNYINQDEMYMLSGEEYIQRVKEEVLEELVGELDETAIDDYFKAMPYKYFLSTSVEKIIRHLRIANRLGHETVLMDWEHNFDIGYTELLVSTRNKPGIFSKIAGALASRNINIIGAQIYTTNDGVAIDTLQVEGVDKSPVLDEDKWERVKADLTRLLRDEMSVDDIPLPKERFIKRKASKEDIPTQVRVDNLISDTHTVIEVTSRDYLGHLFQSTRVLFKLGVDIYVAKVATEADKAIEVFYVTDFNGEKIQDDGRISAIKEGLQIDL